MFSVYHSALFFSVLCKIGKMEIGFVLFLLGSWDVVMLLNLENIKIDFVLFICNNNFVVLFEIETGNVKEEDVEY